MLLERVVADPTSSTQRRSGSDVCADVIVLRVHTMPCALAVTHSSERCRRVVYGARTKKDTGLAADNITVAERVDCKSAARDVVKNIGVGFVINGPAGGDCHDGLSVLRLVPKSTVPKLVLT